MKSARRALLTLATVVVLCGPTSFAKTIELRLYRAGVVNGVALTEGVYRVEVAPSLSAVTLYRGKEAVVTAPCRVGLLPTRTLGDTVFYGPRPDGKEDILRVILADPKLTIDLADAPQGPALAGLEAARK